MIYFNCDYNEGAHPQVLRQLEKTNLEQTVGYGNDPYCEEARQRICQLCAQPDADVQLLVGGTQANSIVIASILRPHQGVLCADTGHINVHETGAVEATGHKVLPLPGKNGKITAEQVRTAVLAHWKDPAFEHTVQPGMVYISFPTEVGTLYSRQELGDLYAVCRELDIPLFIDGARLGYGLVSPECDLTLAELAALCDVFTIGGTKVGALFGEAVVLVDPRLQKGFRYLVKQRGGLLAKGRLLGVQFSAILEEELYFTLSRQADEFAMKIRRAFEAKGCPMLYDSYTNQQYPILPDKLLHELEREFAFAFWCKTDETHTAVRICTSWATTQRAVDTLLRRLKQFA